MNKVITITGATATGKTALSLKLHQYLKENKQNSEIINFDSLVFYKELSIGTAKPSQEEMLRCPHHMINICSIDNPLNASDYIKMVTPIIERLHRDNIIPILVGGSGFYLRALVKGMYESTSAPQNVLDKIKQLIEQGGEARVREELENVDSESWENIHENDIYRTHRALEHFYTHGTKFSLLKEINDANLPYDFTMPKNKNWDIHNYYLELDKLKHWDIIKERTVSMIKNGLIEEVTNILKGGHSSQLSPLQSIGYKETIAFLDPDNLEINNIDELIERIYIATRRLAKSQKTFFKKITPKYSLCPLADDHDKYFSHLIS
jgi:tRNA dimethylallyltransferase